MGKVYRDYEQNQMLLLPPSLRDWLPEGHLAFFINDTVDQLDISAIQNEYEKELRGYPPCHPRMMLKIPVYGYCVGARSSRKIARRVEEDVASEADAKDEADNDDEEPPRRVEPKQTAQITSPTPTQGSW